METELEPKELDGRELPIITDILEKNIMSENFLSHYIFSSNQASITKMVEIATIAFDFRRYMKKFLDRVNILSDEVLMMFYHRCSELARTWHPDEIIDNFAITSPVNFAKYENLN